MTFDEFATRSLLGIASILAAVSQVQPDFWWLLRAGRDIWKTGRVPLVDHYSYTATGRDWPNHEWLWEAVVYPLHGLGGMPLVAALTAATVYATVSVVMRLTSARGYIVPTVLVLTLPLLSVAWTLRPQVTSLLFYAVTMLLLSRERYRWMPVVFVIWANLHAQVALGGVLLVAATVMAALRWAGSRTRVDRARTISLLLTTGASALATLATPLGADLWSYILGWSDVPGGNARAGQQAIEEWDNAIQLTPAALWFWAVLVVVVVTSVRRRGRLRSWTAQVSVAAAVATAPLAVAVVRNIPFFAIAIIPLLITALEFRTRRPIGTVPQARRVLLGSGVVAAVAVVLVWTLAPGALGWKPVSPSLAAAVRSCPGHLFNDYDTGASLIWWVPDVKVFVDNRQDPYPDEVIRAVFGQNQSSYRDVFNRYDVRCALLSADNGLARFLENDGWRRTFADATVSFWVAPPDH